MRKPTHLTLKDVALEAGLSIATVSRALSQPDRLNPQTRDDVLKIVQRVGYRPNLQARGLRLKQTKLVLVIMPSLSPFFLDVVRGAERAARQAGYDVLMGHTDRNAERESRLLHQVASRRADGAILVTSADAKGFARAYAHSPVVVALESMDHLDVPTVRLDNVAGAVQATRHLLELGHVRIAHIGGPANMPMAQRRRQGFEQAMTQAGLDPHFYPSQAGDFTMDFGEAAMKTLLTFSTPPTAIFAANDEIAIGALQAAKSAGLAIGRDLSVIGFDDQRLASLYEPQLTSVHVPTAELGKLAMEQLLGVIAGTSLVQEIVLPTHVVERSTTGRAPSPPRAAGPALHPKK